MEFKGYTAEEAQAFTDRWLPAWTGNDPEKLASFYSEDAYYSDPAIPNGVWTKPVLLLYFKKLLTANPKWVWTHERSMPLENGFLNFWKAEIPVGESQVVCRGVCSVQLREGLIYRNEVYFDRTKLVLEVSKMRL